MTVTDTAADVLPDLTAMTSVLETYAASHLITAITVTDFAINLTDAQAEAVLDALAILAGGNGLTVSGVSVTDLPNIGGLAALTGMTVSDTAADIHDDLVKYAASDIYIYRATITGMSVDGAVHITAAELPDVEVAALARLPSDTVTVDGVPVVQVAAIAVLPSLSQMTVSDTASAVQTDLSSGGAHDLETYAGHIASITVDGPVTLAYGDASGDLAALALLAGPDTLVVSGVPVTGLAAIAALGALDHMTVSDADAAIQGNLAGANSTLESHAGAISTIGFSSGSAVTLTGAEAALVMDALAELPAASLTVDNAAAAQVGPLGALASLGAMSVSDTGSGIATDLALGAASQIEAYSGAITGISVTSGTVEIEYAAAALVPDALAALPSGTLIVDDVPVGHIGDMVAVGPALASMTVRDDGGTISTDLAVVGSSAIEGNIGQITGISLISGIVSLSDTEADLVLAALAKLPSGSATITAVLAGSDVTAFYGLAAVAHIQISDSAGNVQADLISGGIIEAAASKISSIDMAGGTVALTDAEALAVQPALAKLPTASLTVSGVPVADILTIGAVSSLQSMAVSDTGTAIGNDLGLGAMSAIVQDLANISSIAVTSGPVSLTDAEADAVFSTLSHLPGGSLEVTAVPLTDLAHIAGLAGVLAGIDVADDAETIRADLATGSIIESHAGAINSITPSSTVTLTDAQADAVIGVLDKLHSGSLIVQGVSVSDLPAIAALTSLANMSLVDAAATIAADLAVPGSSEILGNITAITSVATNDATVDALTAAAIHHALGVKFSETALIIQDTGAHIVTVTNGVDAGVLAAAPAVQLSGDVVGMDAADATTLAGALHGTQTTATVNVVDTAANLLDTGNAAGIALAATAGVQDTAAHILALAPVLIAMGSKLVATTITDSGPLSASAVTDLLQLPGLAAGSLTISDTGSQIAAAVELNGATGVAFLNAHTVQLSANSVIAAVDAAALEQLSSLSKQTYTISVSDTASHLTGSYLAAVSVTSLIDGVYLKTIGGTVTVTAATAAALTTIPNFQQEPVRRRHQHPDRAGHGGAFRQQLHDAGGEPGVVRSPLCQFVGDRAGYGVRGIVDPGCPAL